MEDEIDDGSDDEFIFDALFGDDNPHVDAAFGLNETEEEASGWKNIENFATTIGIETIDSLLLEKAKLEVPIVLQKILAEIPQDRDMENLQPLDFFNVWFGRRLLNEMLVWLKRYMGPDQVTIEDVEGFVKVQLQLTVYQCSPGQFFDKDFDFFTIQKDQR